MQQAVDQHERRLRESVGKDDHYAESYHRLQAAQNQLHKLVSETDAEKEERYAELHEAMMDMHTMGFDKLDFGRTGI